MNLHQHQVQIHEHLINFNTKKLRLEILDYMSSTIEKQSENHRRTYTQATTERKKKKKRKSKKSEPVERRRTINILEMKIQVKMCSKITNDAGSF